MTSQKKNPKRITLSEYHAAHHEEFVATGSGMRAHRAYYGQFVTRGTISMVVRTIGADKLKASTDPHLNDIPLERWDRMVRFLPLAFPMKEVGDYLTVAGGVCIAKEAARQYLDNLDTNS